MLPTHKIVVIYLNPGSTTGGYGRDEPDADDFFVSDATGCLALYKDGDVVEIYNAEAWHSVRLEEV